MTFKAYNSFEEAMDDIARNEAIANTRVTPSQKAIGYGDYWMRIYVPDPSERIAIFGRVDTLDELDAEERRLGADEDEIASERATIVDSFERGYRFGRAYSVIEPDGELGSTHISTMIPISKEQFEFAQWLKWDFDAVRSSDPSFRDAYDRVYREGVSNIGS